MPEVPVDPLKFRDERRYLDRLKDARSKTGLNDAVKLGYGKLDGFAVVIGVQDFDFMGGSLGMAAGEAVIKGLETAVEKACPFVLFAASGGARMQEGILSLMQMPRTTIAVQRLHEARKPYIVVLTNPTTGGVTASYAMLGDVHIAEPGALIGFAGPRVIEQTIREKLPEGFQSAEYLRDHGMVDMVVHRHDLRATIARLCRLLTEGAGGRAASRASACRRRRDHAAFRGGAASAPSMARLLALHPKRIDLSLDRIERLLAALGHPRTASAAGRSMSPAPTAKVRPSPSCARSSKLPANACTSIPRPIWCGSMSASASGKPAAASSSRTTNSPTRSPIAKRRTAVRRSRCSRWRRRRRFSCSRGIRPILFFSKSGSAAGSTPPMWSNARWPA